MSKDQIVFDEMFMSFEKICKGRGYFFINSNLINNKLNVAYAVMMILKWFLAFI